ncbi:non-ribosomal peptide synthetase [Streptomyces sp. bgisy027]|uniref:non-ribosomal peptide synthetase n=1 Tax=Streptomyces sp. bgisy027 TaxID=3413770 RepID=UPI003D756E87
MKRAGTWLSEERYVPVGNRLDVALYRRLAAHPDHVALIEDGEKVTGKDLLIRVIYLCQKLRDSGVRPGDRVAVYLNRSSEFVVVILAVVFAGGSHVAIDVGDPPERTRGMLEDCDPRLVVTDRALSGRLGAGSRLPVLLMEDCAPASDSIAWEPVADLEDEPAVVIYTSGSTGAPKASLISHRAVTSRLNALQHSHRLGPSDRMVHHTACSFDMFLIEVYWPLMFGATVIVAEHGRQREPEYLDRLMRDEGVTVLYCVVSLLDLFLLAHDEDVRFDGLRAVLTGGEPLSPALVRHFQARSTASLTNLYGPSECTIYCTAWECPRDPAPDTVLIGDAVDDTVLWILDEDGRPVPDGAPGELYIGGAGLAIGYLNRPELTKGRFVPDRLGGSGGRLYRSGDLVQREPSGDLRFLGRVDRQVKIRGYRIELGEIETTAVRHGGAQQAAVTVTGSGADARMTAFVVLPGGSEATDRLRTALRERLPSYMVPATLRTVDALPLTQNGKIDRDLLAKWAAPEAMTSAPADQSAAAEQGLEDAITEIWSRILTAPDLGPDDDFFEAGGDSFKAVRAVKQLQSVLGIPISMRELLRNPTVTGLAATLDRRLR